MNNIDSEELTAEVIKKIVESSLEKRCRVDIETHAEHHEFIKEYIEEKRVRKARIEAVKTQVLGASAIGFFAFLYWVGQIVAKKIGLNF